MDNDNQALNVQEGKSKLTNSELLQKTLVVEGSKHAEELLSLGINFFKNTLEQKMFQNEIQKLKDENDRNDLMSEARFKNDLLTLQKKLLTTKAKESSVFDSIDKLKTEESKDSEFLLDI